MNRTLTREVSNLSRLISEYIGSNNYPRNMFNMTQFNILQYLNNHISENVCQKDLEIETNLKKASITGALDSLVAKGFVERVQAPDDKRKNYVVLTQKSLDLKSQFMDKITEINNVMVNNISSEDLDTFFKVADKVKENIKEAM